MKKDLFFFNAQPGFPMDRKPLVGKLFYCCTEKGKTTLTSLDRKENFSLTEAGASSVLKKCKVTCGKNYTLFMVLNTSYHVYTAIGRDLTAMYEKIVSMYNNNAGTDYTIDNFANSEDMRCEHIHVYRIKSDLIWFDDEYYALPDENCFIGDYFSLYRKSTWYNPKKDWFSQSML